MYTAKNISVYNAAFAGVLAGLQSGRVPQSLVLADDSEICNVANAYAQEFDTLFTGEGDAVLFLLIEDLTTAVFINRSVTSIAAASYAPIINPILTLLAEAALVIGTNVTPAVVGNGVNHARAVLTSNVPDLLNWPVGPCDGVTPVTGNAIFLAAQTTPAENGPYVVGPIVAGNATLTRPSWWANGASLVSDTQVSIGGEGKQFRNTEWAAMLPQVAFVVGTDDPQLFPRVLSGLTGLFNGTFTIIAPIFSSASAVLLSRAIANTCNATDGGYHPTVGGADGITPGDVNNGQFIVEATVLAGTINNADQSTLHWTLINRL